MPFNADFSKIEELHTIEIKPNGWVPLVVEYGFYGELPICYWKIKGTTHTFTIPVSRLDFISSGNYGEHFKETLEGFREDYLDWYKQGFITEWSGQYRDQYSRFIII